MVNTTILVYSMLNAHLISHVTLICYITFMHMYSELCDITVMYTTSRCIYGMLNLNDI